jgi:hypothetical protein
VPAVGGLIAWLPTRRRRAGETARVGLPALAGLQLAAAGAGDAALAFTDKVKACRESRPRTR